MGKSVVGKCAEAVDGLHWIWLCVVSAAGPTACMPGNAAASGRVSARLISCIVPLQKSQQHPPLVPAGRGCQQLCPP